MEIFLVIHTCQASSFCWLNAVSGGRRDMIYRCVFDNVVDGIGGADGECRVVGVDGV